MKKNFILLLIKQSTFTILLYYLSIPLLCAQDCTNTSIGETPINDMGTGTWAGNGQMGGLYPNGSNIRPASHQNAGMSLACQVQPLDTNGNPDPVNGKIGFISIGMSNTNYEFGNFITSVSSAVPNLHPKLTIVNCAKGGPDIDVAGDINSVYWDTVASYLANGALTDQQVQVIWLKHAQLSPSGGINHIDSLYNKFIPVLQNIKIKFPNVKLCYMSSRIYAGYSSVMGNPEPYAYYNGWAVKKLIEDQINGSNPSLNYSGINSQVPWISWSYYPWADGITPRSDGLTWDCPTDYLNDGMHPAVPGRQKIANGLIDFFSTDSTACPWFLSNCGLTSSVNENTTKGLRIFPNPSTGIFTIEETGSIEIYNVIGEKIHFQKLIPGKTEINLTGQPNGIYFVKLEMNNKIISEKLIIQ